NKDKFTPELRILVASLLSMVVFLAWTKYFGPKPPANVPAPINSAQTAPATPGNASSANTPATATPTVPGMAPAAVSAAPATTSSAIGGGQRSTLAGESV